MIGLLRLLFLNVGKMGGTVEQRDGWAIQRGRIRRRIRSHGRGVNTQKVFPIGGTRPMRQRLREPGRLRGKSGHTRYLDGRTGNLPRLLRLGLKLLRLQRGRLLLSSRKVPGTNQKWMVGKSRGCTRGYRSGVPGARRGTRGIQNKVLLRGAVAVVVVVVAGIRNLSQRLWGRGCWKPWLLVVIRVERREVERRNGVQGT